MVAGEMAGGGGGWRDVSRFAAQMTGGRWFTLFASILILSVSGSTYLFGLYSNDIKTSLGYDQTTINLLSFFKDLGSNVGIVAGLILEIAPPWVVLSIGALMNLSGYLMIWLAVAGKTPNPKIWQMCLYICVGANSQAFAGTGALIPAVKNFPESRGSVLGLLKGYVGLSGAIMTQIYHLFYGDNDSKALILLIAWLPAAVSFLFLRTIRIVKTIRQANETKIFYRIFYISLSLAGFLMVLIILQNKFRFSRTEYAGSSAVELVLIFLPLLIVGNEDFKLWVMIKNQSLENPNPQFEVVTKTEHEHETEQFSDQAPTTVDSSIKKQFLENPDTQFNEVTKTEHEHETEQFSDQAPATVDSCLSNVFSPPARGEDYTILQALFSVDMLIIFVAGACGAGGTLTAIDNLGQIGISLGYPKRSTTTFVSLVSIWNYLGRSVAGFSSEVLLTRYKCPRPLLFTIVLLVSCSGHLLIAFAVPNSLYFASVIIGFCFGAQWPLIYAMISEIFGLKYYSTLYNFGAVASPVGAYILNVRVAGPLYDDEALRQLGDLGLTRKAGEDLTCAGVDCYRRAFLVISAATFLGFLVSIVLVVRTRRFYRGDIYKRFREEVTVEVGMAPVVSEGDRVVHGGDHRQ